MSVQGHFRPMHSVAVPINVRCYSNSDIIVRHCSAQRSDAKANKRKLNWDLARLIAGRFSSTKFPDQRRGEQFCSVTDGGEFYRLSGEKKRSQ